MTSVESEAGDAVTLVIPARNAEATLEACLDSVTALLGRDGLQRILVVDDASTDATAQIAARAAVEVLRGEGRGPGAARNLGWRQSQTPLIWFVDADCIVDENALRTLRPHLAEPKVAGAGGTYTNQNPDSLLARWIHEEIALRHSRSPSEVDFLATFDVLYRREALVAVDGFDERLLKAQDMELAYRMIEAGFELRFEPESKVGHFHERRLGDYLDTQARQGYWRIAVYRRHAHRASGDSYSGITDHLQPPLALLLAALLPFAWHPVVRPIAALLALLLVGAALPISLRLWRRTGRLEMLGFAGLAPLRALARGIGLALGVVAGPTRPPTPKAATRVARP